MKKKIDKSKYSVVDINENQLTEEEMKEQGIVYLPYQIVESQEPSKEYDDFMREYEEKHARCPKCGDSGSYTTLVGYILNMDKKDDYKDLNRCICTKCNDAHTKHDRIPSKNYMRKIKLNEINGRNNNE